jgi:hypothetical protein
VIRVSAISGEGFDQWHGWLQEQHAAVAATAPAPALVGR